MPEEFFKIINFLTVFQILIFIIFISKKDTLKPGSKFYLILFLFSILMCLTDRLFYYYRRELYLHNFPHLYNLIDIFSLIYLPALFFYLLSIVKQNFQIRKIQLIHFLPSIAVFINLFFNYYLQPAEVKFQLLQDNAPFSFDIWGINLNELFYTLQTTYLLLGLIIIYKYERFLKANYANINYALIQLLKITFSVFLLARISRILFEYLKRDQILPIDIDLAVFSILITIIGYIHSKTFLHPFISKNVVQTKSGKSFPENKLSEYMSTAKPYLDPTISLSALSDQVGVSERELSQYLNNELNLNFFNFINSYRIEEAKKQLLNKNQSHKTVLEIVYEVGFNNKSAFNREFKRITGQTPTEYRNKTCN